MAKFANRSELMFMNSVGISLRLNKQDGVYADLRSSANNKVIVGELTFRQSETSPTLGNIILEFGRPCQVSINSSLNYDTLNLMYPSSIIQFTLVRVAAGLNGVQPMKFDTPIYALSFQDPTPRNCDALLAVSPVTSWLGFASDGRYRVAANQ